MESSSYIDFIVFLGISQGIFLSVAIQMIQNKNKSANNVLSLLLLIAAVILTGRFFFTKETTNLIFFRLALFVDILVFVFGPLMYLYYRRLMFNEKIKYRLGYVHFIPALAMTLYHFWTYQYSYEMFVSMARNGDLKHSFLIIELAGIMVNVYYTGRCFSILSSYETEEKKNVSYSQSVLIYLKGFLGLFLLFLVLWVIGFFQYYIFGVYRGVINYNILWILIPVLVYFIGFYSLKEPDVLRLYLPKKQRRKSNEKLDVQQITYLNSKLKELMEEEKIYLNHQLTLVHLATQLHVSTNKISWLLNNVHEVNFYDFINKYRVEAFIQKIEQGEHHHQTLLALSMDVGFNSKSTFNKAFKFFVNDTPKNYIKKIESV